MADGMRVFKGAGCVVIAPSLEEATKMAKRPEAELTEMDLSVPTLLLLSR